MIPLNVHSHYSLLTGYTKPKQLIKRAEQLGYEAIAITDFDSLSGVVNFLSSCEKSSVKPIVGTKIRLSPYNGYITLLAKNIEGWKELVAIFAYTNSSIDKSVTIEHLKTICKNCICITGDINSTIYNSAIKHKSVFTVSNLEQSISFYMNDNYIEGVSAQLSILKNIFHDNLYVGLQKCGNLPIDKIMANVFESCADTLGIKCVALNNTFVHTDDELEELQIVLCSREKSKFSVIKEEVQSEDKAELYRFFFDKEFALYNKSYYESKYNKEHIANTQEICDKIEKFTILKNPQAPKFDCPNDISTKDYLLELCRNGWRRLHLKIDQNRKEEYTNRIKEELAVINKAGIESYFIIVQDYVNWAKNQGMLVGPGRGSAAGCLTSYLLGITNIDPIEYTLMFERFYNEGRNSPGKVSYPDIDVDFPVAGREPAIEYIRQKYGRQNVAQVFTLQEMQGRSAITEVLRVYGACPPEFIKEISKKIPQKAAIADKLEEAKEKSILKWTLNNEPDLLKDWCVINNDGTLSGEYATYFEKAIKIEGTFKCYGKHASALVVANEDISSICPMIKDKGSNELLCAIEYEELEQMGFLKFDILGTAVLDKLMAVNELLEFGYIKNKSIEQENDDEEQE